MGKLYFRERSDARDRLKTEFESLRFLWNLGIRDIPQPLARDEDLGFAVYEYVVGQRMALSAVTDAEVDAAVGFLELLHEIGRRPESRDLPPASEACFCGRAIENNINQRLTALSGVTATGAAERAMAQFLWGELEPAVRMIVKSSPRRFSQARLDYDRELSFHERLLSPSDYGFHNAVRRPDGRIAFVDFEYFGWDDPAKTVSDFLLHPAMCLSLEQKVRFATRAVRTIGEGASLAARVSCVYPLFGLKWCTILLNEYVPAHHLRRRFARSGAGQRQAALFEQLEKARKMLVTALAGYEQFPHFG